VGLGVDVVLYEVWRVGSWRWGSWPVATIPRLRLRGLFELADLRLH
jgi:hypothetical protein